LNNIFGTHKNPSRNFTLPIHEVTNPDLSRVINSNEIQTAIRNTKTSRPLHEPVKKNPLVNTQAQDTLNPNAKAFRQAARKANEENKKRRADNLAAKRGLTPDQKKVVKERKASSRKWIGKVNDYLAQIYEKSRVEAVDNKKLERQLA